MRAGRRARVLREVEQPRSRHLLVADAALAAWDRARGYALTQAALIVPYYEHTNPDFSAMARRTIAMVVEDVGNVLYQWDPGR